MHFDESSTVCRAAIRVLHKIQGAHQGCPEVPGKTPNGLSIDLYPVSSTIDVAPFVGEHTEAGNLVLSESACDQYCSSSQMLLLCRLVWLFSGCHMVVSQKCHVLESLSARLGWLLSVPAVSGQCQLVPLPFFEICEPHFKACQPHK